MKAVFLRVLEELHDKGSALRVAIQNPGAARGRQRFDVDPSSFASVPRSPFAYWVSDRLRGLFVTLPLLEAGRRTAKIGPSTGDDSRYVRCWWEVRVPEQDSRTEWPPFAKGGVYSPFYADVHLVIRWDPRRRTFLGFIGRPGRETERPNSLDFFFRPGLTWPLRTKSELSLRAMPAGCVFGHKGPAILVENDDEEELLALLALGCSRAFRSLVEFQLAAADARAGGAARSYEAGVLQRTPVPQLDEATRACLARLAWRAWSLGRSMDTRTETSHAFLLPALLQVTGADVAARAASWSERVRAVEAEFAGIEAEVDDRCFAIYGIDGADRRAATEGFGVREPEGMTDGGESALQEDDSGDDSDEIVTNADAVGLSAELVSWAVGVAVGRFDIRLVTGAHELPTEPGPFEPLPACSPGRLVGEDGRPVARRTGEYPIAFPEAGVLVNDPGHALDLQSAVRAVFDAAFGVDADVWWRDVAALVEPKSHDIRDWLEARFFDHHLRRYSKSRRSAPLYWQLGTSSGRYSVWLYADRLKQDSFFQIQNEVVGPKLSHEERTLARLVQSTEGRPSAAERQTIAAQQTYVDELHALLGEIKRIAPLWNPNFDDGIVLTMAPLWRLVPQHKAWQRELKSKWDELCDGKYDWASIAMHLWPERVIAKCVTHRSLALAHGVEDVFWVEDADGKWIAREIPARAVDEIVRERSSPAVNSALKGLLEVSAARSAATSVRRRGPR